MYVYLCSESIIKYILFLLFQCMSVHYVNKVALQLYNIGTTSIKQSYLLTSSALAKGIYEG